MTFRQSKTRASSADFRWLGNVRLERPLHLGYWTRIECPRPVDSCKRSARGATGRSREVNPAVLPRDQQLDGTTMGIAKGRISGCRTQQETEGLGELLPAGHGAEGLPARGQPRAVSTPPMAEGEIQGNWPREDTIPEWLLV
jgi:hypothetical protein